MVTIHFQVPDYNMDRNPKGEGQDDNGVSLTLAGFNIEGNTIFAVPQESNTQYRLAIRSPYMNEEGEECGAVGWRIEPDSGMLNNMPELGPEVGRIYYFVAAS